MLIQHVRSFILAIQKSNLILKDGKVWINPKEMLLFIKKANEKIASITQDTLEPEKSIDQYVQFGTQNEVILALQGRKESDLHQSFWRALFYH